MTNLSSSQQQQQPERDQSHVHASAPELSASLAAAVVSLGGFLVGYDTGVISGAELLLKKDFSLSPGLEGLVISAVLVGGIAGAACAGKLSDTLGRRRILFFLAIIFIIAALLTACSWTLWLLMAMRILTGLCIGIATLIVPIYISEIAPSRKRGALVTYNQLALSGSIPIAYWIGLALVHFHLGWRPMFALESIPALLLGIGMHFLPETPRWLARKGRWNDVRQVLERLRGPHIEGQLAALRASLAQNKHASVRELFEPGLRIALLVGIGLAIFQQVVGTAAIGYYAPTIFRSAGFRAVSIDILATSLIGVVSACGKLLAIFLLDRVGRRVLLLGSLFGVAVILTGIGFIFLFHPAHMDYIILICLLAYILAFALGLGPIFSLLISEIFPTRLRSAGASIAGVVNWTATLLISISFLTLIHVLGRPWTFWLYALLALTGIIFSWFLVPETKGKRLEDIEKYWENGRHWPSAHDEETAHNRTA